MTRLSAVRYHDIDAGHRVAGHENKCAQLHGHSYRVHFHCSADALDNVGRVIDFSVIKSHLCNWLEENWDHHFLVWERDRDMQALVSSAIAGGDALLPLSIVYVPFNPTAENMARHLLKIVGPRQLQGTHVTLVKVVVEETRKCSASAELVED